MVQGHWCYEAYSFVHVTYSTDENGEILLTCTCKVFNFIHQTVHQQNPIWPLEDTIPDSSFTCLHCRFFLKTTLSMYTQKCKIKRSPQYINEPYVLMGNVHLTSTTKFSVKGFEENTYSTVYITFEYGKCVVTCTHEMCAVQMHNKKKIPKSAKVENFKGHSQHVQTIAVHMESVKSYFPEYFKSDNENFQENPPHEENAEHSQLLDDNIECNFDVETGLWTFPSFTKFKSRDMMDPQLIKYTKKRIMTAFEENRCVELKPHAHKNNALRLCECRKQSKHLKGTAHCMWIQPQDSCM